MSESFGGSPPAFVPPFAAAPTSLPAFPSPSPVAASAQDGGGLAFSAGVAILSCVLVALALAVAVLVALMVNIVRANRLEREHRRRTEQRLYDHTPDDPLEPLPRYAAPKNAPHHDSDGFTFTVIPNFGDASLEPRASFHSASNVSFRPPPTPHSNYSDSEANRWFRWTTQTERTTSLAHTHAASPVISNSIEIRVSDVTPASS